MPLNKITTTQNEPAQLRYLAAARQMYVRCKRILVLQLSLTIAVPVVGALLATAWPQLKAAVALLALIIAIGDVTFLDRFQKRIRKSAAKAQEQFDCATLELPWDNFAVGKHLTPEEMHEASRRYFDKHGDAKLRDWYPTSASDVPLQLGRIICQRTNLWYDSQIRRRYGTYITTLAVIIVAIIVGVGMVGDVTVNVLVLSITPVAPVIIWTIREYLRQKDTADSLDSIRSEAEALWSRAKSGGCSDAECTAQSREFQKAIYDRRSNSPIIFDWIYRQMRPSLEQQMQAAAAELVREVRS